MLALSLPMGLKRFLPLYCSGNPSKLSFLILLVHLVCTSLISYHKRFAFV